MLVFTDLQNLYMALSELIDLLAHERYSVIMGDFNNNLFDVSQTHTILTLQSTITGVSETYYSYHKGVYIAIDKGQLS